MNGHPDRQPWGVVGRDKIRKSLTDGESAAGRLPTVTTDCYLESQLTWLGFYYITS